MIPKSLDLNIKKHRGAFEDRHGNQSEAMWRYQRLEPRATDVADKDLYTLMRKKFGEGRPR